MYSPAVMIHVLYLFAHIAPFVTNSLINFDPESAQYSPPASSSYTTLVVSQSRPQAGRFSTISAAVEALQGLNGPCKIIILPGIYREQVRINYEYPLIIHGRSGGPYSHPKNQVVIASAVSARQAGSNAASATIWVRSPDFKMANVYVFNSFGVGTDTQALALAAEGGNHVYKNCFFSSYQDTVMVQTTASFFSACRIEGVVDFIFGSGTAWFERCAIVIKKPEYTATITAQRRPPGGNSIFVFNKCQVVPESTEVAAQLAYLGRPWSSYAAVMFQLCYLSDVVAPPGWTIWSPQSPQTDHIDFEEYQNYGPGASQQRQLGIIASRPYNIQDVLGPDYQSWIGGV